MFSATNLSLNAPIVLAHGLFGFGRIGFGRLTLAEYFRDIPRFLESLGNRVLVTHVPAVAGITRRAEVLGEQITSVYPDEPVHIIGHSMGGLDARALISQPNWRDRVLSLTTIATPHLGSPLADLVKLHAGRMFNWLSRIGVDYEGCLDVTRRSARAFHRRWSVPPRVACLSVAGIPAFEEVCRPLRRPYLLLNELEGPNDGLVSAASATAFGTPLPSWPVDHLRQMNWLTTGSQGAIDGTIERCYANVLENLVERGFARRPHLAEVHHPAHAGRLFAMPQTLI